MSPAQIEALAALAAAENSIAPLDAMRMAHERVLEERAHMDAQADKDRRHQLDLLNLQNDVNKHALSAQAQLGTGVAHGGAVHHHHIAPPVPLVRTCRNGHVIASGHENDQFCAACGVPLQS